MALNTKFPWGIIGTGRIAGVFAGQLPKSKTGVLRAVGSRTKAAAEKFAGQYPAPSAYGSYQEVLDDPEVRAVYLALPNHLHLEWIIRAAQAGKAILCEKPLTLNHAEAMLAIDAARRQGVFLMEAFMYRCHPVTAAVVSRIRGGDIGTVRFIEGRFAYTADPNPPNYRWQNPAGGGGILDLGGYCVSMARLLAGAALGLPGPAEPLAVSGAGHIGEHGVDEWAAAVLRFDQDVLANLYASQRIGADTWVRVYGHRGQIVLGNPWFPGRDGEPATYTITRAGQDAETVTVASPAPLYANEADVVAAHHQDREAPSPCMTWADSLGNAEALDAWRREIELVFAPERADTLAGPPLGLPLVRRPDHPMQYGRVEGVTKPVSQIVLGTMGHVCPDLPHTCALFDQFYERGGNTFDTAYIYGGGSGEQMLGQWIRSRGVQDEVVIVAKGATPPNCNPQGVRDQIRVTLDRLGLPRVDLYLLHRDNPDVPVGEFIDVFNELKQQGLLAAFGGSNWTTTRIDQANAYARQHGKTGFAASSPQYSLAAWNRDPWGDCTTAKDPEEYRWYHESQLPVFAWSSQANGILTGRFRPADADRLGAAAHVVEVWFSNANFERLRRVEELAATKKVTAGQVSLAYVLHDPLKLFALVGPHTIDELNEALGSLQVSLSESECRWLNLETDERT